MDYEALVRARITGPLGMASTRDHADAGHEGAARRRATIATLEPSRQLGPAALAGAGALRSTTNDMLTFLGGDLGYG